MSELDDKWELVKTMSRQAAVKSAVAMAHLDSCIEELHICVQ